MFIIRFNTKNNISLYGDCVLNQTTLQSNKQQIKHTMLRKTLIMVACIIAYAISANAQCPNNEIWYTTSDRGKVELDPYGRIKVISHTYEHGKGIIKCASKITKVGGFCEGDYDVDLWSTENLTNVTLPSSIKYIGGSAFSGCCNLLSINIPNSVKYIERSAFEHCSSLQSIHIPNSVLEIGWDAFSECTSLKSVNMSNGIKYIGMYAFAFCHNLTSITIPNSVLEIDEDAFCSCTNLTTIRILATTPPTITDLGIDENTVIYVPKKSVELYKNNKDWQIYKERIKPM